MATQVNLTLESEAEFCVFKLQFSCEKKYMSMFYFHFFSELFLSAFTQPLGALCLTSNFVSLDPTPKWLWIAHVTCFLLHQWRTYALKMTLAWMIWSWYDKLVPYLCHLMKEQYLVLLGTVLKKGKSCHHLQVQVLEVQLEFVIACVKNK